MTHWKESPLGEITSFLGGGTPSRGNAAFYGGSIPWVTPKDMKTWEISESQVSITKAGLDNSAARLVPANSVLVVVRSGVLKHTIPVAINRVPVAINQDMKALVCSEVVDVNFLARFVKAQSPVILQWVRATTADNFPVDKLRRLPVPLPPLDQQRRIAKVLDLTEELRAKRRGALAQLNTLAQAIFIDMFGDPHHNPRRWRQERLDSACKLINGRAFKPEEWEEEGLPIIRIQNLNGTVRSFNYTRQALPEKFRVRPGDVLFSWSGTPGTSFGCFRWNGPEGWLNQHIFNVRLNGELDSDFFIYQLNLKLDELIAKAHGGVGLQHVTKGMVDETKLLVPPLALQRTFASRVAAVEQLKVAQRAFLADLDALFASLQDRAFKGEL